MECPGSFKPKKQNKRWIIISEKISQPCLDLDEKYDFFVMILSQTFINQELFDAQGCKIESLMRRLLIIYVDIVGKIKEALELWNNIILKRQCDLISQSPGTRRSRHSKPVGKTSAIICQINHAKHSLMYCCISKMKL